jgi:hypothetical protein
MGPYATSASLVTCILLTTLRSPVRAQVDRPSQGLPDQNSAVGAEASRRSQHQAGCGVQYEPDKELTQVTDPRVQAIFLNLLARFGIAEPVLLCASIPLQQKNFAETARRSDRWAVVTISNVLLDFNDAEVTGMLAHELAHLLAGDPDRPRPSTRDEYLQEEREADLKAAELVGRDVMCAAVTRAYWQSVTLGFESKTNVLKRYRDQRLEWIRTGRR